MFTSIREYDVCPFHLLLTLMVAELQFSKPIIPSTFVRWHSSVKSFLLAVVYLSTYELTIITDSRIHMLRVGL